ncbi:MAG: hypothetical protein A2901_02935 [Elusimicrobia bacterium RIFCSPLOWO2_01_FULL_54_10]|nr:MAG: hypothetical protein A2901_02935 [Elusimicrobia bacterium RIFCSPLOWO2_01_FULL_54_10]
MRTSLLLTLFLAGCSGWEVDPSISGSPVEPRSVSGTGLQSYESLHFRAQAPTHVKARQVSEISEKIYSKIMFDANLLSFKPRDNYPITIFRDRFEYQDQTGMPAWSGGGTLTRPLGQVLPSERDIRALTSIVTFEEVLSPALLAHEISHLIFNEYMAFFRPGDSESVRWLNEGFATYQEMEAWPDAERDSYLRLTRSLVLQNSMSMPRFLVFNPFRDPQSNIGSYNWRGQSLVFSNIDIWYWQARELAGFLIQSQGRYNFSLLLEALKARKPLNQALAEAYPGKWRSMAELENEWLLALKN